MVLVDSETEFREMRSDLVPKLRLGTRETRKMREMKTGK